MNAGRDVERLLADWLREESPGRAPDRVLERASDVIDRTRQRRFVATWRDPMHVSLRGLAWAAAIGVILVGGSVLALRGTPSSSVGGAPATPAGPTTAASASPAPSPSSAQPSSTPDGVTSACDLITSEEAENIAGTLGLLPTESSAADRTTCVYADGGGDVFLRLIYTTRGGRAAFDSAVASPDVEPVTDMGAEAAYDPTIGKLYISRGDVLVELTFGRASDDEDIRRERSKTLGRLVVERL